jgi:hypothetical protein
MKLRIEHSNPKHRLIKNMVVTVRVDSTGSPPIASSRPGALLFDVSDTASDVTITATIPDPTSGHPDVMKIGQSYSVKTVAGTAPVLAPTAPIEQRFTVTGRVGAKGKVPGVFVLKLDLRFLDLTAYAAGLASPLTFVPAHGASFAVLECTDSQSKQPVDRHVIWPVLIPPAVTASPAPSSLGALLFLRPTNPDTYANTDDAGGTGVPVRFTRYWKDPSPANPFYVSGTTSDSFTPTPSCGFEDQLVRSGKAVVLLWPLPHGIDHGTVLSSQMPDLVRSALLLLSAVGKLGQVRPLPDFRLALAGFSAGGWRALETLGRPGNGGHVKEFYAFDPASFGGFTSSLKSWFKTGGKKLRLLAGGYQQERMIQLASDLGNSPDATVTPDSVDYWYTDALYKQAISRPGSLEHFDPVGATPASGSPTKASNIFVKQYDVAARKFTLEWTDPGTSKATDKTFPGGKAMPSHEEAASLVRWHLINKYNGDVPITKLTGFNTVFARVTANDDDDNEPSRLGSIRHEWTVCGGTGAADRQAGFKGFLQLCLEQSGF